MGWRSSREHAPKGGWMVPQLACAALAEGSHLVEVFNMEQMTWLQDYLTSVEQDQMASMGGYLYWWIGLNDVAKEGDFVWPQAMAPANYTNWDVEYGEPYPDPFHEWNCVEMLSAEYWELLWMTFYCDDTDSLFPVCQIHV